MGETKSLDTRHAAALWIAQLAADVANYCDHAEHNEATSQDSIVKAGSELRLAALKLADLDGVNLLEAYAGRLKMIESRNVLHSSDDFDGARAVQAARTWRDLQLVQIEHDRRYHPDVIGLHKLEQLRHYALHLTKLAGAFARRAMDKRVNVEITDRRLPDLLLFGLKLSTVMGEKLLDEGLPESALSQGCSSQRPETARHSAT